MNHLKNWAIALLAVLALSIDGFGCGAQADNEDDVALYNPDMSQQYPNDVLPGDNEIYAKYDADAETGTVEQPWVSSEYYGWADVNKPCYAGSNGTDCFFPMGKTYKLHVDLSACPTSADGYTVEQYSAMLNGFLDGMRTWNGKGGITVQDSTAGGPMFVQFQCHTIPGIAYADSQLTVDHAQIANLPVGPHGGDPGAAKQYNGGLVRFDLQDTMRRFMGFGGEGCVNHSHTIAWIRIFGFHVGQHEMGHQVGFNHSSGFNDLMFPSTGCDDSQILSAPTTNMFTALAQYSGSTGSVTIRDDGLLH